MAGDRTARLTELSRTLSHMLRHEPWLYELELDELGWVPLTQVLSALRRDRRWRDVTEGDIEAAIASGSKVRHELAGGRIRALYGHSTPQRIVRTATAPPDRLFHGTSPDAAEVILREGLRPMGRQYVHLSADEQTAQAVGARKAPRPVMLLVDAGGAARAGIAFYQGNDRIWLADSVPAEFIARAALDARD